VTAFGNKKETEI